MGTTKKTWDSTLIEAEHQDMMGIWLNGQYFPPIMGGAEDDGKGTDGAGDGDGSTEGANSDGTSTDKDEGSGKGDEGADDDKPTLTQKQVDAIVAREKAKASRGKIDPKELGFESGKEVKDFLDAMKKKADEDKNEDEKALEEAIAEAKKEAIAEVLDKANERLTRAEFKLAASKHDVAYLDDAYKIAQELEIWEAVEIDDAGVVSGFDDAFFEELEKAKPYLFKEEETDDGKGTDIGGGRRGDKDKGKPNRETELKQKFPALQANG